MVEPISIGASILASSTVKYLTGKGKRMHFLNEAVENAASEVAENHEDLNSEVFTTIFENDQVIKFVENFNDSGDLISPSDIADTFDGSMLDEEVEATPEDLVLEFLNRLEVEISQDQEIGHRLIMEYSQRIHGYAEELNEGQEEILFELQKIAGRLSTSKGYEVFQPITDHFQDRLKGEHPQDRYDLPFFGREDELKKVVGFPDADQDILILSGRAGIGKTRLVVEGSLILETEHPNWQVYWTNILAGNIDDGLEELDLEDERHTILFVDDARNADQVKRLFDLAEQHQSYLKLIFAERSYFISSLQGHANQFRDLQTDTVQLPPLNTDDVHDLLQEYYGITHPELLERIITVSEGIPLFVHLLAQQFSEREQPETGSDTQETLEAVFEDVIKDIQTLADQEGLGSAQELERYVNYLSAIGELDTDNEEQLQRFRDMISVDVATEADLREILTESIGLVSEQGGYLSVQPDALQEYIVYNSFFDGSPRDYQDEIYDAFEEFSGKSQINLLATIHHRYDCREARKTIREALNTEIENMTEYGYAERVRLLRRFKILASSHPHYALKLVRSILQEEYPEKPEEEQLIRSSAFTTSPAADLMIESIEVLTALLRSEPEKATQLLLLIAVRYPQLSQLQTQSAQQSLRQEMRPSFRKSLATQQKILDVIGDNFHAENVDSELRIDLLDAIGEVSRTEIHDFSIDPIDQSQMRSWQGAISVTEPLLKLREQAIDILIEVVRNESSSEVRKAATEKLLRFENAQTRYYSEHQELVNRDELIRILDFATEYVSEGGDLQCVDILSRLTESENTHDLGIEEETEELTEALENDNRYQLLQQMRHRHPKGIEEQEAEFRNFAEELEKEEFEPSDFAGIISEITDVSFNQFFTVLADERPDLGEALLEEDDLDLDPCLPSVMAGICSSKPQRGKDLVDQFIEESRFELASAGLSVLATQDIDYVKRKVDELLENQSPVPPVLVSAISQVVNGHWGDHQDWVEAVLLALLQDTESLGPQLVDSVLLALPVHSDDSQQIDSEILSEMLDYLEDRENLTSEPHSIEFVIAEMAERTPEQFVDFCLQRVENEFVGVSLLPSHLNIDTDRMRDADGYDGAVEKVCERILDSDYYTPAVFSDLTEIFRVADISEYLLPRIAGCSEDQLFRIIQYCKYLPLTDEIEKIYLKVLIDGMDNIQDEEQIHNAINAALYTDAMARVSGGGVNRKEDEITMLRDWQDNPDLPSSVRWFAEEAEDQLINGIEQQEERFRDI
jgi:hypothetical protein